MLCVERSFLDLVCCLLYVVYCLLRVGLFCSAGCRSVVIGCWFWRIVFSMLCTALWCLCVGGCVLCVICCLMWIGVVCSI